jgi:hypothetical protein
MTSSAFDKGGSVEEATASAAPVAPRATTDERGFGPRVMGMLLEPREEFPSMVARPRFWLPLVCWMVLGLALTAVWMQNVDSREFIRSQIELSGRAERIPADRMEQVIESQTGFVKVMGWFGPVAFPLAITFGLAGLYLIVFRFFYAGQLAYPQSAAIVAWSFFTVKLVTIPANLLVMFLKGDWNVIPEEAIQAGASLFFDRATTAKPLYSLMSSLDLFSFWVLWLLATGYGVAVRRPVASAAAGVVAVWVVYVLGKVAFSAFF